MPLNGYKSITVPEEAYTSAKQLVNLGLEENIGKAFTNAIREYAKKREELIRELQAVKVKWSNPQ